MRAVQTLFSRFVFKSNRETYQEILDELKEEQDEESEETVQVCHWTLRPPGPPAPSARARLTISAGSQPLHTIPHRSSSRRPRAPSTRLSSDGCRRAAPLRLLHHHRHHHRHHHHRHHHHLHSHRHLRRQLLPSDLSPPPPFACCSCSPTSCRRPTSSRPRRRSWRASRWRSRPTSPTAWTRS